MNRHIKTFVSILLVMLVAMQTLPFQVFADSTTNLKFDVTYGQTEGRKMLSRINDYRSSKKKGKLTYDYDLEQLAMTRAAEIAVSFDHKRPDGSGTVVNIGENIAYGYKTEKAAFNAFKESSDHSANMRKSEWKAVAIGHAIVDGKHYWVQLFRTNNANPEKTSAYDSTTSVYVPTRNSILTLVNTKTDTSALTIELGETGSTPAVTHDYRISYEHRPLDTNFTVKSNAEWVSSDESIASVSGNTITAKKLGNVTLTGTLPSGSTVLVPLTVVGASLEKAKINLEFTEAEFTGSSITPEITTVKLGDETLVPYTDYIISYRNNIDSGTATVVITGIGQYSGKATTTFYISGCQHKYDAGKVTKEATCTSEGEKSFTCSECDYVKTETIAKLAHSDANKDDKCDVCKTVLNTTPPASDTDAPSTSGSDVPSTSDSDVVSPSDKTSDSDASDKNPSDDKDEDKDKDDEKKEEDTNNPDTSEQQKHITNIIIVTSVAGIAAVLFAAYAARMAADERRRNERRRRSIRR